MMVLRLDCKVGAKHSNLLKETNMMTNRHPDFYERLNNLVVDWKSYLHDISSDLKLSRLHLDTCTQYEVIEHELRVIKNRTRYTLAANTLVTLEVIGHSADHSSRYTVINSLLALFNKTNDEYLDYIIDYNLINDEVTKVEYEAAIEVLKTLIHDLNNMNVYGE